MKALSRSFVLVAVIVLGLFSMYGVVGASYENARTVDTHVDNETFTADKGNWTALDASSVRDSFSYDNETIYNASTGEAVDESSYEWGTNNSSIKVTETCATLSSNCLGDGETGSAVYTWNAPNEEARSGMGILAPIINALPALALAAGLIGVIGILLAFFNHSGYSWSRSYER